MAVQHLPDRRAGRQIPASRGRGVSLARDRRLDAVRRLAVWARGHRPRPRAVPPRWPRSAVPPVGSGRRPLRAAAAAPSSPWTLPPAPPSAGPIRSNLHPGLLAGRRAPVLAGGLRSVHRSSRPRRRAPARRARPAPARPRASRRLDDQGDGADDVVLLHVHHFHALGRPPHLRDPARPGALDHPVLGDEQQVLVLADDQGAGEAALLLGQLRGQDAFGPPPLTGYSATAVRLP